MGRIKSGTLPTARITKGCYLRMRVDGRVFNLGKVGSKIADDRRPVRQGEALEVARIY